LPDVRRAALRPFRDPSTQELIDEGLLICLPAETSVTGDMLVELHCHGSRAVVRDLEAVLGRLPGLRPAGAGEFTRRAFANGRMDLARVEGLGDLLAAETSLQRRAAMAMMGGALSQRVAEWTRALRRLSARIEAILNFSDEGDVDEAAVGQDIREGMARLAVELEQQLARPTAERLKEGVHVVIAGPPNAGKSTLLNALVGRDAAIVSPIAGTTRDVIEVPVAIAGVPFLFADTAGLRGESDDPIEKIGIGRAEALLMAADIVLWLGEPDEQPKVTGQLLQVHAKLDLAKSPREGEIAVSAVTGQRMDALIDRLCAEASALLPQSGDYALSQRQRAAIMRAHLALSEGTTLADEILVGETLRAALVALDELTGRATTEAVLDELFSGFCIGK